MAKRPMNRLQTIIEGRVWRILSMLFFVPIFYAIWSDQKAIAVAFLASVTLIAWYTSFYIRHQDVEKPYYQIWISFLEGLLSFAVMINILIRNLIKPYDFHWLLSVGTVLLLFRLIGRAMYSLGIAREGKKLRRSSFWSKATTISISITLIVYVINIEHFQQISMVISILLMCASGIGYLYWYYRDSDHRQPLSVATQLTMSRIVLTPFFIWVFFYDNDLIYHNNNMIFKSLAIIMVVGFMITDFLDGYLARKMNQVSTLGKYLDPFSDKISNMTIFLCFMASGYAPVWMVALIYFRESSVETLRTLAANQDMVIAARTSGKWKTAIQGIGIMIILLGELDPLFDYIPQWEAIWNYVPTAVMGFITFATIASGLDYFVSNKDVLKKFV